MSSFLTSKIETVYLISGLVQSGTDLFVSWLLNCLKKDVIYLNNVQPTLSGLFGTVNTKMFNEQFRVSANSSKAKQLLPFESRRALASDQMFTEAVHGHRNFKTLIMTLEDKYSSRLSAIAKLFNCKRVFKIIVARDIFSLFESRRKKGLATDQNVIDCWIENMSVGKDFVLVNHAKFIAFERDALFRKLFRRSPTTEQLRFSKVNDFKTFEPEKWTPDPEDKLRSNEQVRALMETHFPDVAAQLYDCSELIKRLTAVLARKKAGTLTLKEMVTELTVLKLLNKSNCEFESVPIDRENVPVSELLEPCLTYKDAVKLTDRLGLIRPETETVCLGLHHGQTKLLLSEYQFLEEHSAKADIIVYVGSGPGIHLQSLQNIFRKTWILFDTTKHKIYERNCNYVHSLRDPKEKLFQKLNRNIWTTLKRGMFNIFECYADVQLMKILANQLREKVLFISDLRSSSFGNNVSNVDILFDNALQLELISSLKPIKSMIKFRPPIFYEKDDDHAFHFCKKVIQRLINIKKYKSQEEQMKGLAIQGTSKMASKVVTCLRSIVALDKHNGTNIIRQLAEKKYMYPEGKINLQAYARSHSNEARLIFDYPFKFKVYDCEKWRKVFRVLNLRRTYLSGECCLDCSLKDKILGKTSFQNYPPRWHSRKFGSKVVIAQVTNNQVCLIGKKAKMYSVNNIKEITDQMLDVNDRLAQRSIMHEISNILSWLN